MTGHVTGNANFDGSSDIKIQCKIPEEIDVLKKIWTEISNVKSSIEESGTGVNTKNFAILYTGNTNMYGYTNIGGFRIVPTGSYLGWKAYLPSGGKWLVIRQPGEPVYHDDEYYNSGYSFKELSGGTLILTPFENRHNIFCSPSWIIKISLLFSTFLYEFFENSSGES